MSRSPEFRVRRAVLGVLAGVLLACGGDGSSDEAEPRSIPVTMTDNAYSTGTVTAEAGETVIFEFANDGKFEHEAVIGDVSVQDAHEAEMSKPGAGVTLPQPGAEATRHTFDQAGSVLVGCHVPGHYRDGMKFEVKVA